MKNVLMVAPYFTPRRRVGALRPFKFAIHLRSYGYQPTVLTIRDHKSICTEREKELLKEIPVIEIDPPFDRTTTPNSDEKSQKKERHIISQFMDWIDRNTPMDTWIYLFLKNYWKIIQLAKEVKPDLIWATGDPWSGLWVGRRISKALELPLVADFRDPWTLTSVNLRKRSGFSEGIDQEIEKSIVNEASRLIFTSKLTEEKYRDRYYLPESKTATIYNSFDRTMMKEHEEDVWDVKLKQNCLNIIFMGRFRRLSPATPIILALKELKEENLPVLRCVRIHSFGQPDIEEREMIRDSGLEANFIYHERVVPENVNSVLKSADILLLSTNQERREIIPAKLWDYLSVEIPILSIAPNPEVGEIIMRSKAGIQIKPEQTHELAEILKSFAQAKKSGESLLLSPEKEIPDRNIYEAKQKTGELAALFDDLLSNA